LWNGSDHVDRDGPGLPGLPPGDAVNASLRARMRHPCLIRTRTQAGQARTLNVVVGRRRGTQLRRLCRCRVGIAAGSRSYGLAIGTVGAASSRDCPVPKEAINPTLPRSVLVRGGLSRDVRGRDAEHEPTWTCSRRALDRPPRIKMRSPKKLPILERLALQDSADSIAIISSIASRSGTSGNSLIIFTRHSTGAPSAQPAVESSFRTSRLTRTSCGKPCVMTPK